MYIVKIPLILPHSPRLVFLVSSFSFSSLFSCCTLLAGKRSMELKIWTSCTYHDIVLNMYWISYTYTVQYKVHPLTVYTVCKNMLHMHVHVQFILIHVVQAFKMNQDLNISFFIWQIVFQVKSTCKAYFFKFKFELHIWWPFCWLLDFFSQFARGIQIFSLDFRISTAGLGTFRTLPVSSQDIEVNKNHLAYALNSGLRSPLNFSMYLHSLHENLHNTNMYNSKCGGKNTYCRIIIVCGRSMFADSLGYFYPRISVPTSV